MAVSGEESYIAKLTIATLGCTPSLVKTLPMGENKLAICRLYGKASAVKFQEDKAKGQVYTFFAGTFEGINLQDGTVQRSGKLFLPKGISEIVEQAISEAQKNDDKASVSFAFEIRAVKAGNPIGYSYEAAALKSPQAEDELAEMRTMIAKLPTHEQKQLAGKPGQVKTLEGSPAKKTA
jgi:hypothetical protein